jgi:outer membrane protein assembly factor BamB
MSKRVLVCLVFFCVLALSAAGCSAPPQGYSGVVSSDDMLYLGATDGKVRAVDPTARGEGLPFPSSEGEWSFAITMPSKSFLSCGSSTTPATIYSTPVVVDERVCVGLYDGKVMMLASSARIDDLNFPHRKSGEWVYPEGDDVIGAVVGSPAVVGKMVYVCSSDGVVYALDVDSGDEEWRSELSVEKLWTSPVVAEGALYVSTFDGHIYALSIDDGRLLPWSFEAEVGFASSPLLYGDTILAGSFDNGLYAVRIGDDEPLWKFEGGNWFWALPVVRDDVVYAACLDGKVYALDAGSGRAKWDEPFDAGSPIVASPVTVDDSLVIAAESGDVYVIDMQTGVGTRIENPEGDEKPSIDGTTILASLCTQDGIVYIRAQNNSLYPIDVAGGERKARISLD